MVITKISYQVPADNGPLVFPIQRSLVQIYPGSNELDVDMWEEIKKIPRTQELLQQRLLYSPDYTAIIQPPLIGKDENKYQIIDASEKSNDSSKKQVQSAVVDVEPKPARVASKANQEPLEPAKGQGKTAEKTSTEAKKTAVSKFQSGVSSPSS
jgi:hypothetical protein